MISLFVPKARREKRRERSDWITVDERCSIVEMKEWQIRASANGIPIFLEPVADNDRVQLWEMHNRGRMARDEDRVWVCQRFDYSM